MKIAGFDLLEQVGQGGTGAVFSARGPRGEKAAVKLLRGVQPGDVARFEREQRLLEKLGAEEGFVPLLASGVERGAPYIVMPFLAGGTLRDRIKKAGRLSVAETVALGERLALALGRAHELGVVHRDVKPENVLFPLDGPAPDYSKPLVADLGLAKHFRRDVQGASRSGSITQEDELYGTVQYMALEQWQDLRSVGPPADIFALGAVLYECLTGVPPFLGNLGEIALKVRDGKYEPIRAARPDVPAAVARAIEQALATRPAERHASGAAFAAALRAATRSRVFALALVGVAALAASAVAALVLKTGQGKASLDSGLASGETVAQDDRASSLPAVTRGFRVSRMTRLTEVLGSYGGRHGSAIACLSVARSGLRALTGSADRTCKLWDLATGAEIASLEGDPGRVRSAVLSPGGLRALSGGDDRKVRFWDVESGKLLRVLGEHPAPVRAIAFAPDGARAASGSEDGTVLLWDLATGERLATLATSGRVLALAFAGETLRAVTSLGTESAWDVRTGAPRETPLSKRAELRDAHFDEKGERLLCLTEDGVELRGDGPPRRVPVSGVSAAALSLDGERAVLGLETGALVRLDLAASTLGRPVSVHRARVADVAFLPDGRVASVSDDQTLRLTDLATAKPADTWSEKGHGGAVLAVAPREDGRILTAGLDGTVRLWERGALAKTLTGHAGAVTAVLWRPDGRGAWSAGWDGTVRAWDLASGESRVLYEHPARLYALARSLDGEFLFAGAKDGVMKAIRVSSGEPVGTLQGHEGGVLAVHVSPDGKHALTAGLDGSACLWDLDRGEEAAPRLRTPSPIFSALFAADGRSAIVGCADGSIVLGASPPRTLRGHEAEVFALARAGALLVSASQDQTVRLWDLDAASQADVDVLRSSSDYGCSLAFAADSKSLLVGTARGVVLRFELLR